MIPWSCPVPCFGDLTTAGVATVGINPSNREFLDEFGEELEGDARRLPTLKSLGLSCWADLEATQLRELINACLEYFRRNPYDRWFSTLERILQKIGGTFYGDAPSACHLDLVPYATTVKWGLLPSLDRRELMQTNIDALGLLLRDSHVEVLILNGQSVVSQFEASTGVSLNSPVSSRMVARPKQRYGCHGDLLCRRNQPHRKHSARASSQRHWIQPQSSKQLRRDKCGH